MLLLSSINLQSAVLKTGGFIFIPVPLCLTFWDLNFKTGFLTTLGLFL